MSSRNNYTLADTAARQRTKRCKPIKEFPRRKQITGTRVVYVAPEGPDRHLSRISLDIPFVLDIHEPNRSGDKASDQNCQLHTQAKGKLKKLVERLHPDGAFGGARLLGGAIRRRMKTIRKISHSVHRKNKNAPTTGRQGIPSHPLPSHNHLPTLTHNMTINEFGTMSQQANPGDISWPFLISATQRVGTLLSRRNSAPFALDGEVFDISTTENKNTSSRSERQTSPPLHAHKREANPESPQTLLNARTDSGVGELNPRTFNVPDFYSQTLEENVKEAPSPRAKIRTEVDKQMCNLSIIGDSEDTESTIPTPSASILRHQKKKGLEARQFTDAEMTYLENVVRALCNFIIEKALDKSGVQYRNTFAWKFHTETLNEFDRSIGHRCVSGGRKFKIKDFVNDFDFGAALLERLEKEGYHRELGLRWSEISFVDRRIKVELSYTLVDDESE